jgi:excinuclease UvrABC nuclease subunit
VDLMSIIPELPLTSEFHVKKFIKKIPFGMAGLYFIYNVKNEILYIGQASSLRNRLRTHFNKSSHVRGSEEFHYFKYHEVEDVSERDIYETYYISKLRPKYNIAKKSEIAKKSKTDVQEILIEESDFFEVDSETLEVYSSIFANAKGRKTLEKLINKHPKEWKAYILNKMNKLWEG